MAFIDAVVAALGSALRRPVIAKLTWMNDKAAAVVAREREEGSWSRDARTPVERINGVAGVNVSLKNVPAVVVATLISLRERPYPVI